MPFTIFSQEDISKMLPVEERTLRTLEFGIATRLCRQSRQYIVTRQFHDPKQGREIPHISVHISLLGGE